MRNWKLLLLGVIFSLLALFGYSSQLENGNTNAISMYFITYLMPVLLLPFLNTFYIKRISIIKNKWIKVILSFFPVVCLLLIGESTSIDEKLPFIARVGAIAIIFTNAFWIVSVLNIDRK